MGGVLQGVKDALISSGVRVWSIADLTNGNVRSPAALAFTMAFIVAGALSFIVLMLAAPAEPGMQLSIINFAALRQSLGAPLPDFSVQLQRANGVAMRGARLSVTLMPSIPFSVDTRIMNQLVRNFDIDCRKDVFWKTRTYFCNMSTVPGAQSVTDVVTDENGLATVSGLSLAWGPPGEYEVVIRTQDADPIVPDIERKITVQFFAAIEKLDILSGSHDEVTGVLKAKVRVEANMPRQILSRLIAAVIPMRFPRISGTVPGWLPVADIRNTDEPVINPARQFFNMTQVNQTSSNSSEAFIEVSTDLIGSSGALFGAALFLGGQAVPLTSLSGRIYFPETVAFPFAAKFAEVGKLEWVADSAVAAGAQPLPKTITEATPWVLTVKVVGKDGKGVPGRVVTFRTVRYLEDAAVARKVDQKFLPFNVSSVSDKNGFAQLRSNFLFSLKGEVGNYVLIATLGQVKPLIHLVKVQTRVLELSRTALDALVKAPRTKIAEGSIVPSQMQFVVLDKLSGSTIFPLPGKVATLEFEETPNTNSIFESVRVEYSPSTLVSDSHGYFYVDGLRVFVRPRPGIITARNFSGAIVATVDGERVHAVPVVISVPAPKNATKAKKFRSAASSLCLPFNVSLRNRAISSPYTYTVPVRVSSYGRPVEDIRVYSPLSDSGLDIACVKDSNGTKCEPGSYEITVSTSLTTVKPYAIFTAFLMHYDCLPSRLALNPWISGGYVSFAMLPVERNITTLSVYEDVQQDKVIVNHLVAGASSIPEGTYFEYYPAWYDRECWERTQLMSSGLKINCSYSTTDDNNTYVSCPLPRAAFVVPSDAVSGIGYRFVPNLFGVFLFDGVFKFSARYYNNQAQLFRSDPMDKPVINTSALLPYPRYGPVEQECFFGPTFSFIRVAFRLDYGSGPNTPVHLRDTPLPPGTAVYFKLRRRPAGVPATDPFRGEVYDMWHNESHMEWAALTMLIDRSDDPMARYSAYDPAAAPSTGGADYADVPPQGGGSAAGATGVTTPASGGSSYSYYDPYAFPEAKSGSGTTADFSNWGSQATWSDTGSYGGGSTSDGFGNIGSSGFATGSSSATSYYYPPGSGSKPPRGLDRFADTLGLLGNASTNSTTNSSTNATYYYDYYYYPPPQSKPTNFYINPPVAYTDKSGVVEAFLLDLAGFRTVDPDDTLEIIMEVDGVELDHYFTVGQEYFYNDGPTTPCETNVDLKAPVTVKKVVPTVLPPAEAFDFEWETENDVWRFGLVSSVMCVDSITRAPVSCEVDTSGTYGTWFARFFISRGMNLHARSIIFSLGTPSQRKYDVLSRFPGFSELFRVGQIYLGSDGCVGAIATPVPSPASVARTYGTSVTFLCAGLPLKNVLVQATVAMPNDELCPGGCALLSSPRDLCMTDRTGTARFSLLIASAPTGTATVSFAPATLEVFEKAAAMDAIFAVGVGKTINGINPSAATNNAYETQTQSAIARLFSSLRTLASQQNRPAVSKPFEVTALPISLQIRADLDPLEGITFENAEKPMTFLKTSIFIAVASKVSGSDIGLSQRVSIEVWNEDGTKIQPQNWVTFANSTRRWFMTDNSGAGSLPRNAWFFGQGGTFTLRFNCRGVLSPPTKKFTVTNPAAASLADLQQKASENSQLFLLISLPLLLANIGGFPVFVSIIASAMTIGAMFATPAVINFSSTFAETPLLGAHILVTYLIVFALASALVIIAALGLLKHKYGWARIIDREERSLRAFRYYRWLALQRPSRIRSLQDDFTEAIEEEQGTLVHKLTRPAYALIDKLFFWSDSAQFNFKKMIGEWESIRVFTFEAPPMDPPEYLLPPMPEKYVVVQAISISLMIFMTYTGITLLFYISTFFKIFAAYLKIVDSASGSVFNETVLNTLKSSVDLVLESFPQFGFLRSLVPLIETLDLGSIISLVKVLVDALLNHIWLIGILSLLLSFAGTAGVLYHTNSIVKSECLKQRRKLNREDAELADSEAYLGVHAVIFAFQALASFVIIYATLCGIVIFFVFLPGLWRDFWASPTLLSLGTLAIITTTVQFFMSNFCVDSMYVEFPTIYGLWSVLGALNSIFSGIAVLVYRVGCHIIVGFAFSFGIVTRPLIDPLEDPVYKAFVSMIFENAGWGSNPTALCAVGMLLASLEQRKFYETTKQRAALVEQAKRLSPSEQALLPRAAPEAIVSPSDFGNQTFYMHVGHHVRIAISHDMGLFDDAPWISEARRDPASDDWQEDPMVAAQAEQEKNNGNNNNNKGPLWSKLLNLWFTTCTDIAMRGDDVERTKKEQEKRARDAIAAAEKDGKEMEPVGLGKKWEPAFFPYDQPRWPSYSPEAIRHRKFQRKWYLLLLLHQNPSLQQYRKHRLVLMSGYHFAPNGSAVERALVKLYGEGAAPSGGVKSDGENDDDNRRVPAKTTTTITATVSKPQPVLPAPLYEGGVSAAVVPAAPTAPATAAIPAPAIYMTGGGHSYNADVEMSLLGGGELQQHNDAYHTPHSNCSTASSHPLPVTGLQYVPPPQTAAALILDFESDFGSAVTAMATPTTYQQPTVARNPQPLAPVVWDDDML